VNISVDTNVLIRCAVRDDTQQAQVAEKVLKEATLVAISTACLCEFVWVLRRIYDIGKPDIAIAIGTLLNTDNVVINRPAVEAGLALLEAGGDFADGVMAYEGAWLGGQTFVSFDKKAVTLLTQHKQAARLLA